MQDLFQLICAQEMLAHCATFAPLAEEHVPLGVARGRVLSRDVHSPAALPPFARSIMDGFAVRACDIAGCSDSEPALLQLCGEIMMGESGSSRSLSLAAGQCLRIWTGGKVPRGADAVVMQEDTKLHSPDTLAVFRPVTPGSNIIHAGEDYSQDSLVLSKGHQLRPQDLGLLAGFGIREVAVHQRPKVAILSTGDELVPVEQTPSGGQVRDINSTILAALVEEVGGMAQFLGICKDNLTALQHRCCQALDRTDMILLSGGSSMGRRDFTHRVFSSLPDSELLVHGVSARPGKPAILAKRGNQALLGLPGHAASAMVVFYLIARPLLRRMLGLAAQHGLTPLEVVAARQIPSPIGREDYVRVRLLPAKHGGPPRAEPIHAKPGLLNSLVRANGLLPIARDSQGLEAGENAWALLFPHIPHIS